MNRKELSQNHWKYYLMLEKRFVESIEFVELHEDNFDAFSNGYALLIQAIEAELDTVFKELCRRCAPCCPAETEIQNQAQKENRRRNLRIPSRLRRRMGRSFS